MVKNISSNDLGPVENQFESEVVGGAYGMGGGKINANLIKRSSSKEALKTDTANKAFFTRQENAEKIKEQNLQSPLVQQNKHISKSEKVDEKKLRPDRIPITLIQPLKIKGQNDGSDDSSKSSPFDKSSSKKSSHTKLSSFESVESNLTAVLKTVQSREEESNSNDIDSSSKGKSKKSFKEAKTLFLTSNFTVSLIPPSPVLLKRFEGIQNKIISSIKNTSEILKSTVGKFFSSSAIINISIMPKVPLIKRD